MRYIDKARLARMDRLGRAALAELEEVAGLEREDGHKAQYHRSGFWEASTSTLNALVTVGRAVKRVGIDGTEYRLRGGRRGRA